MHGMHHKIIRDAAQRGDDKMVGFLSIFYFSTYFGRHQKPSFSLETVQPIYESEDLSDTVFMDIRVPRQKKSHKMRTTTNIGFGYRKLLLDETLLLGGNVFFDHEAPFNHQRMGAGLEVRSSYLDLAANYYAGISGKRTVKTDIFEEALSGYDFEVGLPLSYLLTTRFFVKYFNWKTTAKIPSSEGLSYSVRFNAGSHLFFEVGATKQKTKKAKTFGRVDIRIPLHGWEGLDSFDWNTIVSDKAFECRSVRNKRLSRVRRQHGIVVERTGATAATAATVDVIKAG